MPEEEGVNPVKDGFFGKNNLKIKSFYISTKKLNFTKKNKLC